MIIAEFAQMIAVIFHRSMPWRGQGSQKDDEGLTDFLQSVLPEFLVGSLNDVLLVVSRRTLVTMT